MTPFDESMDGTIDEVARAMTAAPAPALAARVVARLRPRSSWGASWLAPAAVILATTFVAFLVVIRSRPATVRPPAVTSSPGPLESVATNVPPQALGRNTHQPTIRRVDTTRLADAEAAAWRERAVPALGPVPALTMAAIQPTALPITQLEVAPIEQAPPLVVKAIGSER
jgi:hypothetical protein